MYMYITAEKILYNILNYRRNEKNYIILIKEGMKKLLYNILNYRKNEKSIINNILNYRRNEKNII